MIPRPPGITRVEWSNKLGSTPARCYRDTGVVLKNPSYNGRLNRHDWDFITAHEAGHIVLQTSDEFEADRFAFDWCVKHGMPLSACVKALTRVLNFPSDKPAQRAEQEARCKAMIKMALDYDYEVNGNKKADMTNSQLEQELIAYNDSFLGLGKAAKAKKEAKAQKIRDVGQSKVLKAQAELELAKQGVAKGLGGIGQGLLGLAQMSQGGGQEPMSVGRESSDPAPDEKGKKILGMSTPVFIAVAAGTVLLIGVLVWYFGFKK